MIDSEMFGYSSDAGDLTSGRTPYPPGPQPASDRGVQYLEDRFERLSLVCMAMWSLLQDKTNLTERDLLDRVQTIDLMDGQVDGKAGRVGVTRCGKCDRPMSARHLRCIYCGADKPAGSAFDRV